MPSIPTVQIRQQYAQLDVQRQREKLEIVQQPAPLLEHETTPAKLEIQGAFQTPLGDMNIDQRRAREALGIGSTFAFMDRVTDEAKRLAMEGVAKIVQRGNQAADIAHGGNVFAEQAAQSFFEELVVNYEGPFEIDPVDIHYTAVPPKFNYTPSEVHFKSKLHTAEITFTPSVVQIYLAQKPSLEFIPPEIDLRV